MDKKIIYLTLLELTNTTVLFILNKKSDWINKIFFFSIHIDAKQKIGVSTDRNTKYRQFVLPTISVQYFKILKKAYIFYEEY